MLNRELECIDEPLYLSSQRSACQIDVSQWSSGRCENPAFGDRQEFCKACCCVISPPADWFFASPSKVRMRAIFDQRYPSLITPLSDIGKGVSDPEIMGNEHCLCFICAFLINGIDLRASALVDSIISCLKIGQENRSHHRGAVVCGHQNDTSRRKIQSK